MLVGGCATNPQPPIPPGLAKVQPNIVKTTIAAELRTIQKYTLFADFQSVSNEPNTVDEVFFDVYTNLNFGKSFRIYMVYPTNGGTLSTSFGLWSPVPELYFRAGFTVITN